jgi:hypothetical protein
MYIHMLDVDIYKHRKRARASARSVLLAYAFVGLLLVAQVFSYVAGVAGVAGV